MAWTQLLVVLSAATISTSAVDQVPRNSPPEIVVQGTPTAKEARALAGKFTRSVAGGPIARWSNWLCFSFQGLSPDQSVALFKRIERNAAEAGVQVINDRACSSNILIGFATDADQFSADLVKYHPSLFRDYYEVGLASHHDRDVLAAPKPVRWLPVERSVGTVGSNASVQEASHINDSSHITTNVRGDKVGELIIVDPRKLSGITWQQLGDYLSMIILTDPGMDEHFSGNRSIMSIFTARDNGETGPPELTDEDRQILRGYYLFDPYIAPQQQIGMIASSLRAPPPAAERNVVKSGEPKQDTPTASPSQLP